MNSRQRFRETLSYGSPDRVPYFEEGIRAAVVDAWRRQGHRVELLAELPTDRWEELQPVLEPRPEPVAWPHRLAEVESLRTHLDPRRRLPRPWARRVAGWARREHALTLRVHRGFFLSLGVHDWSRLVELVYQMHDEPEVVRASLDAHTSLACELADRVLAEVAVDAVVFSEPIGGNDRPLLSPSLYEELVLGSYGPLIELCRRRGVEQLILRTYANARPLIPALLRHGFTCLWACEVDAAAMDYRQLRRQFGRELRLIGGIDLDVLRGGRADIERELGEKLPPLLADGGYLPLADGRVRADIPFDNYLFYRRLLARLTAG